MTLKRTFTASALMIFTMVCLNYLTHGEHIQPNRPLSTFPRHIGEWTGKEKQFDRRVYDILGVDDSFLCNYSTRDGRQLQLYIGFYQSQRQGDLIHSPKHCMPGAGWTIIRTSLEEMAATDSNPVKMKVIKLLLQKGNDRQVVLYWFQSRGRLIASEYMQKLYLVVDSITRRRTDGSFVRLIAPITDGDERRASEYLKSFARLVLPILQEYIPS